ncbi:hypothetical protein GPJ56_005536 [Histomonas meleagridis]|uniref:uncharacterized protein n=1 Tax=Histomonas meleagridis TaxID=135588 RepID=UPI00355ABCB6|nr:hypothetical protein GPJ56_005536 [Histomonas meleagridis]KAH0799588.1 hypothetical protein GO595_007656 [Histomonas meleagridis]
MGRFSQTRNAIRSIKVYNKDGSLYKEYKLDEKGRHIFPLNRIDLLSKEIPNIIKTSEPPSPSLNEGVVVFPSLKKISYEEELSNLENMAPIIKEEPSINFDDVGANFDFDFDVNFCFESI